VGGAYDGKQIVGMDLHRRRSVLVRMTETGDHLETVRISNDPDCLRHDGAWRRDDRQPHRACPPPGSVTKVTNRRRISLQVNAIRPSGAGRKSCSLVAITASSACASIASRVHRRQEVQRQSLCSSSQAFPGLERLLDRPASAGERYLKDRAQEEQP
jgi:hypothetical protein